MKLVAGVDIGGTKANVGLLDEGGRILVKRKIPVSAEKGCAATLEQVAGTLNELLAGLGTSYGGVTACGVGLPGTVSADGRTLLLAPNLGWANEACASVLESLTGIPARLVQDTRAAAYGEYRLGAARGRSVVLCVTLGTGIGAGLVIGGAIFHGALGGAGEIGHMVAVPGGRLCGCGKRGCMETYCSGRGIAETASLHPGWAGRAVRSEEVFRAAAQGDEAAGRIIAEAVELLGASLTNIVNTLSPDAIVFSGGMCVQHELYVKPVIRYIRDHAYSLSAGEGLLLATAELGEDAPMAGAAILNA